MNRLNNNFLLGALNENVWANSTLCFTGKTLLKTCFRRRIYSKFHCRGPQPSGSRACYLRWSWYNANRDKCTINVCAWISQNYLPILWSMENLSSTKLALCAKKTALAKLTEATNLVVKPSLPQSGPEQSITQEIDLLVNFEKIKNKLYPRTNKSSNNNNNKCQNSWYSIQYE